MPAGPVVVALPGFTRRPPHLARLAEACNAVGLACLRPSLAPAWNPALYMSRRHLRKLADRLAPALHDRPVVVAGHSAGAAAGAFLALQWSRAGVDLRGIVLIDGVDSPNRLIAESLPSLDTRVAAVVAPPSPCNRQGALQASLTGLGGVRVRCVEGAGHGDVEGPGVALYRWACGQGADEAAAGRFLREVLEAIEWAMAGAAI
jgi:pimeloyl-ACP methyl ester carboxylesterase